MEVTMYKALKGVKASMETSIESTSEPTSSDSELTTKTETSSESNTQGTTSPAESSSNSSAPVGASVGGVLGGLAILALIGFGLWFIRHKKRQAGNGSHVVATVDQPPVVPYHPQQSVTHAQGEANYQPLASGIPPEPKAYSPSSNMRHPAFNELQPFYHDSTNPAGYH
jgi:predicted lipid-binding transport protein (Tim44 family)